MTTPETAAAPQGRLDPASKALLILALSLLPALVVALPLTLESARYLAAEENVAELTLGRAVWRLTGFAVALAPFLAVVVSLGSAVAAGADWPRACRIAARWALGLGLLALLTALVQFL